MSRIPPRPRKRLHDLARGPAKVINRSGRKGATALRAGLQKLPRNAAPRGADWDDGLYEPQPSLLRELAVATVPALLVTVDTLWNLADWTVVTWWVTIPLSFVSVFVPTVWLQRRLRGDRWSVALAKGVVLGLVAAVPTSLTGTPVGMALLAWAGVDRWRR